MYAKIPKLSAQNVADREGCGVGRVRRLLRQGRIIPAVNVAGNWAIVDPYIIINPAQGRPPGAKNKQPYPKGTKRPNRKKRQADPPVAQ